MRLRLFALALVVLAVFLSNQSGGVAYAAGKDVPRVDKDTLKSWLGDPNLLLIDVRLGGDWQGSDRKIKGAERRDPQKVKDWAGTLPKGKKIVLYCA